MMTGLTDPSLKQIIQYFFGYNHYDEYIEYRLIKNPDNPAKPFQFGPMLVCNRHVFWLLMNPELLNIPVMLQNFRAALPKYNMYELTRIFMSINIRPDQVIYLTEQGIYVMALGEETMELLNFNELQAR